ncbi:exodeoxyribonuclease VII small subunit [Phytohalomonas tamaricis]|uniref:exodeoxyribonuclease VII small subunit n=1 Tax=Phytohalomonas tamaricis TaxID=2081032 RepID=UPI0021D46BC8|nr:exodeoxyribonuclease VII small subunit [Phytohalomonas tamaricis]
MAKDFMDEQDAPRDEGPDSGEAHERDPQDFAATLSELEALVGRLESGDLTLEQSLGAFERGIRLTRDAQRRLDDAELKVQALLEQANGSLDEVPFDAADEENASRRGPVR